MKRNVPPLWLSTLLLALVLLWRGIGAPVTAEQFQELEIPFWQARVLLPGRIERIFMQWPLLSEPLEKEQAEEVLLNVYVEAEQAMKQMELEDYVCGVVAAEMPAAYHLEALKAQAVAARTRALKQQGQGGCSAHPGADICTEASHCQAYTALEECRQLWQDSYEAYCSRILRAGLETQQEYLSYQGQPITVLYHAISGGRTEDAQTVFSQSLPYLVSVESAGEENARGFQEDQHLSYEEIAKRLSAAFPDKPIAAVDVQRSLAIDSYTDTGRVKRLVIGSHQLDGADFRQALGLRSTWFTLSTDDSGITFHQRGYGHGVGMSQAGANAMAARGADYQHILLHYYPGVSVERQSPE